MTRVAVTPDIITKARLRAGFELDDLARRFPKIADWEDGEVQPTLKQLNSFANAVHIPVGYLFLPDLPEEKLPIPDFRTIDGQHVRQASPNLLDMIYACQERQAWYKDFALATRQKPLEFVGSASLSDAPENVASTIAAQIGFDLTERAECSTWEEALRLFVSQIDKAGILVMASGIVLSNTNRKLDVQEFRGFALTDTHAPLIFVNGGDTKSGQMFTFAHELAHIWLGSTAISNVGTKPVTGHRPEEIWCNAVAAELLVPLAILRGDLIAGELLEDTVPRLTRKYKVSTLVILRRLLDAGHLSRSAFDDAWQIEVDRLRDLRSSSNGGDFYRTTLSRVSKRFARALVESALEGQTLYRDAFRMLGVSKNETFNTIGRQVGAIL